MSTWILLLRGINVGGKNILPMKELVRDLQSLQLRDVQTCIQSGNAVFQAPGDDLPTLGAQISAKLEERHGLRPHVLLLSPEQLENALALNPFKEAEPDSKTLHFFFLASTPAAPDIESLSELRSPTERYRLTDRVFYLHAPQGIGRSKLAANVEKSLGVAVTARNWRTVQKLRKLVENREGSESPAELIP